MNKKANFIHIKVYNKVVPDLLFSDPELLYCCCISNHLREGVMEIAALLLTLAAIFMFAAPLICLRKLSVISQKLDDIARQIELERSPQNISANAEPAAAAPPETAITPETWGYPQLGSAPEKTAAIKRGIYECIC